MTESAPEPVDLSVVIVTHNSAPALGQCLPALAASLDALPADVSREILVVDNASSDETKAACQREESVTFLELKRNTGFGAGCNHGVAAASGEFLLFLNPDVALDKSAMQILMQEFQALPNAGAVAPRMRHPDGSFQATCRNFPDRRNILASRGSALGKFFSQGAVYTLADSDVTVAVPAAAATCLLMRRELFLEIGGFDERFFMFMEDTDLCLRLHQAGFQVYFIPAAGGTHAWGSGSGGQAATTGERMRRHHQSVLRYFRKHDPGFWSYLALPCLLGLNRALKMLILALRARGKP